MALSCMELSYYPHITLLLFVLVHSFAPIHAKDAKGRMVINQPYLWQNIILQVVLQWVMAGQMANMLIDSHTLPFLAESDCVMKA
jgi:hypothetical protein